MVEVIGIVASVMILASFFVNGEKTIRAANIVGSAVFIIYGVLIGSFSVIFLNSASIIVNTIKIYKINKERKSNETDENLN